MHIRGRLLPEGLAPEWDEEGSATLIPYQNFDFESLDGCEDFAKESLKIPGGFRAFVGALKAAVVAETRQDIALHLFAATAKFSNQYMAFDILKDCFGLAALEGKTGVDYARQWGVSKEAWQQQREKMRRILNPRKTRTMRNESARENMRLRNHRRTAIHHELPKSM